MKPGYATTEFLIVVALAVVTVAALIVGSEHTGDLIDALMIAVPGYAISRGIAKRPTPVPEAPATTPSPYYVDPVLEQAARRTL